MSYENYRLGVLNNTKGFNTVQAIKDILNWFKQYKKETNLDKVVIGISGGKDSTIVAKLLVELLGKEKVIGLLMPNGEQKDLNDSLRVVELLGIKYEIVNIEEGYWAIIRSLGGLKNVSAEAQINIAPRIRMTTLYTYGQTHGCRVAGTGNLSERTVGYTTKFGDNASDFNLIGNYTSLEVMRIGEELGLPLDLVYKTPADGLSSMSDEEKLGITYVDIHKFIRGKSDKIDENTLNKICNLEKYGKHKQDKVPMADYKQGNYTEDEFAYSVLPDVELRLNENNVNSAIKAHILSDDKMRELGFTDCSKLNWYFSRLIKFPKNKKYRGFEVSFNVTIPKNGDSIRIDILDEAFCQPYDYQNMIINARNNNRPVNETCKIVFKQVEEWMEYLQNNGVLSGHVYGEYI